MLGLTFSGCDDAKEANEPPKDDETPPVVEILPIEDRPLEQWNFLDEEGRVLILRGVNLSGTSKGVTGLPRNVANAPIDAVHFKELSLKSSA